MTSNNISGKKRGEKVFAIVFLVLLLLLFSFVAFTSIPRDNAVNIQEEGINSFLEKQGEWYLLEEGDYEVLGEFDEYITRHSTFFYPIKYHYFNVKVTDSQGTSFIMAVRSGKKTEELRKGNAVKLFGMVSPLDEERMISQSQNLNNSGYDAGTYSVCLNDNDDSVLGLYVQTIVFGLFAILDLGLILLIIAKR